MSIEANVKQIRAKIPHGTTLIAVTKTVGISEIKELLTLGVTHMGENRVQDFLLKHEALKNEQLVWHFIGSLQTNKVKKIIDKIDYLHSLDREDLALEINKHAKRIIPCFVQVNVSKEETKHGISVTEVKNFIEMLGKYDKIKIIGLMTMANPHSHEVLVRQTFKELKTIQQKIQNMGLVHAPCQYLSMGMSQDYELAISEGASFVRIGSALFK
jgi:PLP dependent protein